MLKSNYIALRLIQEFNISAVTDVTGFGLAGHLAEMLRASKKSATVEMDKVPLLDATQDLINRGIESTLAPDNRRVSEKVRLVGGDSHSPRLASLFDPQTSGGLLFGVPESGVESVLRFLDSEGYSDSCVIGSVVNNEQGDEVLAIT